MLLIETIDALISESMKAQDKVRLGALREIKTNLMKVKTSGEAYTEDAETKTLVKLVKQYKEAINECSSNKELVEQYSSELSVIQEFAPKEATDEDIINKVKEIVSNISSPSMKDMKNVMNMVKSVYPTADGGLISKTFRSLL